jgi:hypothetical protein
MKKFALFCAVALLLSAVSTGCSSNGSSGSWCRIGSLFPTSRTKEATQVVYTTAATTHCDPVGCDPCEPVACSPCEPVTCNPCDPICDPCTPHTGIYAPRVIPGPMNN